MSAGVSAVRARVGRQRKSLLEFVKVGLCPLVEGDTHLHLVDKRELEGLKILEAFPNAGRAQEGPLAGYRVWRGPWRWMLCVYEVLEDEGRVVVLSVHDARSSTAPL